MPGLPSGTVTFFFTDVEGSTRMVRELGDDRFAELLETHRSLIRAAVSENHGHEFGTQGDAVFAAFEKASDASLAAVAAQRALAAHEWPGDAEIRIRLGLHSGEAVVHGDNYVGQEVHRASRICDAGHGGQIVVSERTAALVRDALPRDVNLAPLGEHRLKDMGAPEALFQLSAPGLPASFERLRSALAPNNLPRARSSFVGREKELAALTEKLEREHLVTLTGIGGSGKTRLAIEAAQGRLSTATDGVFFVDLAPLGDPDLVAQAAAEACRPLIGDISDNIAGGTLVDRLAAALSRTRCMLLIDNCEHLIDEAADLIDAILEQCPDVKILATSREALGLEGEQIVPVPSMRVPEDAGDDAADTVQLFVERARATKPEFSLSDENRDAVYEICRRLDGIPLAVELAATRIAQLSPRQIAERLEDRFRLLGGGRRRVQRQQTLAAALDWSHELLSEQERAIFRRLAVFAGRFTLEAAEHVTAGDPVGRTAVFELLASLVAKSIATVSEDPTGDTRYKLLETVRMYAAEKLDAAGEAEAFRTRQRDWVVERFESIPIEELFTSKVPQLLVVQELDNVRAAVDWCIANDEPSPLARIVSHIHDYWNSNFYQEGLRLALIALDAGDRISIDERVACHSAVCRLASTELSRDDGVEHATKAIELAAGKPSLFLVVAYGWRGFLASIMGSAPGMPDEIRASARTDTAKAIEIAEANGSPAWIQHARLSAGISEQNYSDHSAAAEHLAKVVESVEAEGNETISWVYEMGVSGLALSKHLLGRDDEAVKIALAAMGHLTAGTKFVIETAIFYRVELAVVLAAGGHARLAQELLQETLGRIRRQAVIPLTANHVLGVAGIVEFTLGRPERAARLLAASRSLGGAEGTQIPFRTPGSVAMYTHYLPKVRAALDRDVARAERAAGQTMNADEALDFAEAGLDLL